MYKECIETDVLVTGGSLEGCIAAIELAGMGKRVLLTEKNGSLGGAVSNGLETILRWNRIEEARAQEYGRLLWEQAGLAEGRKGPLLHDQKAKVVLARMLKKAGVTVLTHIFPYEMIQERKGVLCRAECKTGTLEIRSGAVIDGQAFQESAGMAGLCRKQDTDITQGTAAAEGAVKWNGIPREALKKRMLPGYEEGEGYLTGIFGLEPVLDRRGIHYACDGSRCCHSSIFGETIFSGIKVTLPELSVFALSDAMAGMRIYAYMLRDYLRENVPGFEQASIIHVAPAMNLYGLRKFERKEADRVIPIEMERYSNEEAIVKGLQAAGECMEI